LAQPPAPEQTGPAWETEQSPRASRRDLHFSEHWPARARLHLPEIEPRTFSFNTRTALPDCQGLGGKLEIDPELLIPDRDLSLNEGAIIASEWRGPREEGGYYWQALEAVAREYHIDLDAPVCSIPPEKLNCAVRHARPGSHRALPQQGRPPG